MREQCHDTGYAELQVTSNFSFLRGASHPEELTAAAHELGYAAIAITDRNTLAGIVRAHAAMRKSGTSGTTTFIPACRFDLMDGPSLLAYPTDLAAYGRLSALLTKGNLRTEKGHCELYKADVFDAASGMIIIAVPPDTLDRHFAFDPSFAAHLAEYRNAFGRNLYLAASKRYAGDDAKQLHRLSELARAHCTPLVATNDVHYHITKRRFLQDILTCIREKCTIDTAGYRLFANRERHLKTVTEMHRLFQSYPDALERTLEIADACRFSLDQLEYRYPKEVAAFGSTPQAQLELLAWQGASERYPRGIGEQVAANLRHELAFIQEKNYAEYFLTVYDIVRFAREKNILCQGRGSAANSTVCYCLGITAVDPTKFDLLFERFISSARNEPPDIDVDFEHERREEVMQYVFNKYGRDRAAIVATVTQQHQKGAIRDVGKAMGLSVDTINLLSGAIWQYTTEWFDEHRLREQGLDPADKHLRKVLYLTKEYLGFPRQLGQHSGGFVITDGKLNELCPILNARMADRTCIEWNKDDIDALGFMKIDVLALGMLTCVRKAFDLAKLHYGLDLTLANIPQDDKRVYDMISQGDTIGVFQIESRAQQAMLPRLRPQCFYDLVIEVAIVRPGPIQGDMVHPYLRRRNGEEAVDYPSKELEEILSRTLGVPLFQEQAMKIAIVAAGFTPAEADELRRSMATFKLKGLVTQFEDKLVNGMIKNGYTRDYAMRVFKQLEGFGSYGFPESHAASFALLVYVSSWLKCFYPDVFACALLNAMPMGFYQPAQIVIDARKHDVTVRSVDVNHSAWDNSLEEQVGPYRALRLGFRQVKGLREDDMNILVKNRGGGFATIDAVRRLGLSDTALEKLADADAFRSLGLDRRAALWALTAQDRPIALFADETPPPEPAAPPTMAMSEHVVYDYAATALSLKAHPVSFLRGKLQQLHITATGDLKTLKDGAPVRVAGLVLVRQRPGTAGGICFMTIEDETGFANVVLFQSLFEEYRKPILQARLIMIEGKLQREGEVMHVIAKSCHDLSKLLRDLTPAQADDLPLVTLSRRDDKSIPTAKNKRSLIRQQAQESLFPKGRNFQ